MLGSLAKHSPLRDLLILVRSRASIPSHRRVVLHLGLTRLPRSVALDREGETIVLGRCVGLYERERGGGCAGFVQLCPKDASCRFPMALSDIQRLSCVDSISHHRAIFGRGMIAVLDAQYPQQF